MGVCMLVVCDTRNERMTAYLLEVRAKILHNVWTRGRLVDLQIPQQLLALPLVRGGWDEL